MQKQTNQTLAISASDEVGNNSEACDMSSRLHFDTLLLSCILDTRDLFINLDRPWCVIMQ